MKKYKAHLTTDVSVYDEDDALTLLDIVAKFCEAQEELENIKVIIEIEVIQEKKAVKEKEETINKKESV